MAKKKQEEAKAGSPAWMATFSDLMNLLLCFFVLLFSMSSVDAYKFEELVASLQSSFSILPSGGSSIGEGQMISSGVSQLEMFDNYFNSTTDGDSNESKNEGNNDQVNNNMPSTEQAQEVVEQAAMQESEKMAEQIEKQLAAAGLADQAEVDFNAQFVLITLNGAMLFDSGSAVLRDEAKPFIEKLSAILQQYSNNIIEVEGHTDNVPIHSGKFEDNNVLSMYRALYVADYIRDVSTINPAHIKSAGRGEYVPVSDNGTAEGRARNRRVELKVFNSMNSKDLGDEQPFENNTIEESDNSQPDVVFDEVTEVTNEEIPAEAEAGTN